MSAALEIQRQHDLLVYRKIGWRLLPVLMTCYLLAYIDRQNIGFAKLQFMSTLGFNEAIFGIGGGLFYLGYSLFEVPSNLILRKVGARTTLLRIMISWGICATLFGFMQTATHFYALRILLGIAEAGFFPGILLYISFWIPASRRASFTAVFMAAMPLSGLIGSPISGYIMQEFQGYLGLGGWQWMFILEGVPSILMGIVAYRVLSDSPATANWLSPEEKAFVLAELTHDEEKKQGKAQNRLRDAVIDPRLYGLALMAITLLSCLAGVALWTPTVIKLAGVRDLTHVGVLAALPPLVAIVCQQINARHSDRWKERRWHAAVPVLAAAVGFAILPFLQSNLTACIICLALISAGLLSATGPYWALPAEQLSGSAAAGGIALITTIGGIGAFASSTIAGLINTWAGFPTAGLWYFAGLCVLGSAALLLATRSTALEK
jgi:sugar phosphate permease